MIPTPTDVAHRERDPRRHERTGTAPLVHPISQRTTLTLCHDRWNRTHDDAGLLPVGKLQVAPRLKQTSEINPERLPATTLERAGYAGLAKIAQY